jgi:hypothetical protein
VSITVAPLKAAQGRMDGKVAVGSARTSQEWRDEVPLAMRERGFFSARLQSAHMAQGMLDMARKGTDLTTQATDRGDLVMSKSLFVRESRKMLDAAGYRPDDPAWEGTMLDHRTRQRLGLIYDHNVTQAREYARWQAGQDEGALDAYPAQELIREESREAPREWRKRWADAGGRDAGGRMIALKSDPVWARISRFQTPFPPFDFNSGMGVEDVSREDAEDLGLIGINDVPVRPDVGFNDALQASVSGLDPVVVDALVRSMGDQVVLAAGVVKWQPNLVTDFVAKAVANKSFKGEVSLGLATARTVDAAKEFADLSGYELKLTADETRHAMKGHGEGNERDRSQIGLTAKDFAIVPDLWRWPDEVLAGDPKKPNTLKFSKDLAGILTMVTWRMNPTKRTIYFQTLWKKKNKDEGGAS